MMIKPISRLTDVLADLNALLIDCVDSGASVGFLPPLDEAAATSYWSAVEADMQQGNRQLLVAEQEGRILGAVQLALAGKANARHRAEVEKLMVHRDARGQGLGRQLMQALDALAVEQQRSLLVLDTWLGDVASDLYRKMGYIEAGQIPGFALSASGELDGTVFFYKTLPVTTA